MASNRIRFNSKAFVRILNSPGTNRVVRDAAYAMASRAGGGVRARVMQGGFGGGRPIGVVATHARTPEEAERQREALESAVAGG